MPRWTVLDSYKAHHHQEKQEHAASLGWWGESTGLAGDTGEQLTIWGVLDVVIELAVAPHLGKEQGNSGHADPGQGAQRVGDLPTHLVL